jgi:hypothetical protein
MPQPDRNQSMRALGKAHRVRAARAQLRRGLKAQTIDPVALMRGGDEVWEPWVAEMRLDTVLGMVHGFGEETIKDFLHTVSLPGRITLVALTFEKRAELADLVHLALYGEPPIRVTPA